MGSVFHPCSVFPVSWSSKRNPPLLSPHRVREACWIQSPSLTSAVNVWVQWSYGLQKWAEEGLGWLYGCYGALFPSASMEDSSLQVMPCYVTQPWQPQCYRKAGGQHLELWFQMHINRKIFTCISRAFMAVVSTRMSTQQLGGVFPGWVDIQYNSVWGPRYVLGWLFQANTHATTAMLLFLAC